MHLNGYASNGIGYVLELELVNIAIGLQTNGFHGAVVSASILEFPPLDMVCSAMIPAVIASGIPRLCPVYLE
jgi:hypothetical protein